MTKNPLYNAAGALLYITFVVTVIRSLGFFLGDTPDNEFLAPLSMLSLLVLSVATMSYVFFYQPLLLILKGEQTEAGRLFLKTIGIFAVLTVAAFVVMVLLMR